MVFVYLTHQSDVLTLSLLGDELISGSACGEVHVSDPIASDFMPDFILTLFLRGTPIGTAMEQIVLSRIHLASTQWERAFVGDLKGCWTARHRR